jgi:hypothetical protein
MAAPIATVPDKISGDKISLTNWTTHLEGNLNWLVNRGADLASATTLLDFTNRCHKVTGTVTIRNFAAANAKDGQFVHLYFQSALVIEHNGGGTGNIRCGGANINTLPDEVLTFVYDGSVWWLTGRSAPPQTYVGAVAFHNADQSLSSGSETALALNSETKDSNAFHDPVTNNTRLTVPSGLGGVYYVAAYVPWATGFTSSASTAPASATIRQNGTTRLAEDNNPVNNNAGHNSIFAVRQPWWIGDLVAGDYVEILAWHSDGGARSVGGRTGSDPARGVFFSILRVG